MIKPLIYKEFRQHWWSIIALVTSVCLICGLLTLGKIKAGSAGNIFEGLMSIYYFISSVAVLLMGYLLFVIEFKHNTRSFFESLPISRWKMISVKIIFYHAILLSLSLTLMSTVTFAGHDVERVSAAFYMMLIVKVGAYTSFITSVGLLLSLLGRYRLPTRLVEDNSHGAVNEKC